MLVLKRQCLSKRRPQIPKSSSSSWTNVCDKPLFSKSCFLVIISDRHHPTTSLWLSPMRQPLYWLTWHKWCNGAMSHTAMCHNVTVSQIAVSKSQNILNEGRCSIVRGVERKGSPSQNFWHRLQRRLYSHSLQKELVQIWCQRRSMAAISYLQMIPNLCNMTGAPLPKKVSMLWVGYRNQLKCPLSSVTK